MQQLVTIFKKELADHFSSYRFLILFALIAMVSLVTVYMVGLSLSKDLAGGCETGICVPDALYLVGNPILPGAVRGVLRPIDRPDFGI